MNKSVSRFVVVVAALAAMLSVFSIADAQTGYAPTDPVTRGSSFEPDPATANSGAFGFASINPVASADATAGGGTGGGDATGGLAITGSETDLPLAISISLLALGGTAVVASRKRDDQ